MHTQLQIAKIIQKSPKLEYLGNLGFAMTMQRLFDFSKNSVSKVLLNIWSTCVPVYYSVGKKMTRARYFAALPIILPLVDQRMVE